jgi:hypothetical protein
MAGSLIAQQLPETGHLEREAGLLNVDVAPDDSKQFAFGK